MWTKKFVDFSRYGSRTLRGRSDKTDVVSAIGIVVGV